MSEASYIAGRYAAIDIGTVTCRLLVADISPDGTIEEVRREMAICNLGMGVDETHRLAPESIERVGMAVERFMEVVRDLESEAGRQIPVMAVATSASRDAENAADFEERLARAGLDLNIVPGEREAELSFAGASSGFPGECVMVVDVGGGSTEVIVGEAGKVPDRARSFNVGCRRVTERFLRGDPPSEASLADARAWIEAEFRDYLDGVRADDACGFRMVAVAGTATSVVSMRENMVEYDGSRVHGATVTRADVDFAFDRLSHMTEEQRTHVTGLHPGRAPVIVAGVLVLQQVMALAGVSEFTASEHGILYGIIMAAASR